ncbi:MAG: tRNA epoxyqueuosine(34) reductase QueG [Ilumatobacter sp.]|uniref:tRNA epoxyqueuosine(34) reductase QueG n=3 Tax=Ilumatobacter sp. TaxID=1967498 RepID=UPI00329A20AA
MPSIEQIRAMLADHGIHHVGVTDADVLETTRQILHERKDAGLNDGMQFTYRNPDRSTDPRRAVPDAQSVIVAARPYLLRDDPAPPIGGLPARVGRYAWVDHYGPLRVALRAIAEELKRHGHRAQVFADDNSIVDRAVAHRAGLGWFGKNANLLLPGAGSFFVLGCIVTNAVYEPAQRPAPDGCGSCVRCLDDCPTQAIIAPGVIDGARCLSWILQKPGSIDPAHREAVGDRIYGCDDCQDVCPITVRLGRRDPDRNTVEVGAGADVQSHVDVLDLLDADDATIEARYGRWWIAGREMRWLRRNALIVIGNVAGPGTDAVGRRVRATLDRYRADPDPILAEHAAWAADRIDTRHPTRHP